jgi:hypothetical protein
MINENDCYLAFIQVNDQDLGSSMCYLEQIGQCAACPGVLDRKMSFEIGGWKFVVEAVVPNDTQIQVASLLFVQFLPQQLEQECQASQRCNLKQLIKPLGWKLGGLDFPHLEAYGPEEPTRHFETSIDSTGSLE